MGRETTVLFRVFVACPALRILLVSKMFAPPKLVLSSFTKQSFQISFIRQQNLLKLSTSMSNIHAQRGFGLVTIVLATLVISIIIFSGWTVWRTTHNTHTASTHPAQGFQEQKPKTEIKAPESHTEAGPKAGWKT